jgi:hypothetical protein
MMMAHEGAIMVGVLGQWASGKTEAARTLISHLGGESEVTFITDRELFTAQAVRHILELPDSRVTVSYEGDGGRRLEGEHATVWLGPGEDLHTVDLSTLRFLVDEDGMPAWHSRARVELGNQICVSAAKGKPVVIEAAYGPEVEVLPGNPFIITISDLFSRMDEVGAEARLVKWIIVEASHDRRSERNLRRPARVPVDVFDRYAADGGDLAPDHQKRLEEQGTTIRRVANNHDDIERFRADIIAALEEMVGSSQYDFTQG